MLEIVRQPWPWYIGGPLIGLTIPILLFFSNRRFGISSSFRHICAATSPRKISYFSYEWKKEKWNLFFVTGIVLGGIIASQLLANPEPMAIDDQLARELSAYGITNHEELLPAQLFSWSQLQTVRGIIMFIVGGFFVGFGTRYAGGCTSGHSIMGLSNLQPGSFAATVCFMAGGIVVANFLLPIILKL